MGSNHSDSLIVNSEIFQLLDKGKYQAAEEKIVKLDDSDAMKLFYQTKFFRERGELQKGLHHVSIALNQFKEMLAQEPLSNDNLILYYSIIGEKAYLEYLSGLFDLSLSTIQSARESIEKNHLEEVLRLQYLFFLLTWANVETSKGHLKIALDIFSKVLEEYQKINNLRGLGFVLNDIGSLYYLKGDLTHAIDYYSRSLEIKEQYGNPYDIAYTLNNIGAIYYDKGELKKAQDVFERSLSLYEKSRNFPDEGNVNTFMGLIQFSLNNAELAIEYLEKGLRFRKALGNEVLISSSLLNLIIVLQDLQETDHVLDYLDELQYLSETAESTVPDLYLKYAIALLRKNDALMRSKVEAMDIFLEIITEKTRDFEIVFNSMFHLCELYLEEYTIFQNDIIFGKAKELVLQIVEHAQNSNSSFKIIDSLILEAKFEVIEGNYETSINILDHARLIAKEKNLTLLEAKVCEEMDHIEGKLDEWRLLLEKNSSLINRIVNSGLREYLTSASIYYKAVNHKYHNQKKEIEK